MFRSRRFLQVAFILSISSLSSAWETPSPRQYHIQTDEGPQRYFRYQTDSTQYRKEKRLADGTIVGTYAWIDADGILRQNDYIADSAGYRILKSKNVYVGRNIHVGDAVKAAKKYPASSGTLVKSNTRPVITVPYNAAVPAVPTSTYVQSTTPRPSVISSTTSSPYVGVSPNHYVSYTPASVSIPTSTEIPVVEITPHSYITNRPSSEQYVSSTVSSSPVYYETTPSVQYIQPVSSSTPAPVQYQSSLAISTPTPQRYVPTLSVEYQPPVYSSTPRPQEYSPTEQPVQFVSTPKPNYENVPEIYSKEVDQNALDYNPNVRQGYRFQNGPTYPLDQNGRTYSGSNYDGQRSYDGVSVTNDGFRYYIPRAYHEEQTLPGDRRSGSFGYIDPFGIRRVIYYNAAPGTGFQHRKNNRYVGFHATPYDPRPPY